MEHGGAPGDDDVGNRSMKARSIAREAALNHLRKTLPLLDLAGESMAAIHVSHALALVDGTGGGTAEDDTALFS